MLSKINISILFLLIYLTVPTDQVIIKNANSQCSLNRNLIKFNSSLEYVFQYEIDTFAKIKSTDHLRPSSLKFKSEIKLNRFSNCDFVLRFDKLEYDLESDLESYNLDYLNQILSRPFYFKEIDGEIKDLKFDFEHLKDEKLKKWIRKLYENLFLTLQLPLMEDVEQDEEVNLSNKENFDNCAVNYKVKDKRKSYYEIKSTKNSNDCLKNKLMNKFLINSRQDCDHFVKNNMLFEVHCFENNKANLLNVLQLINTKLKFIRTVDNQQLKIENQNSIINDDKILEQNILEKSKGLLTSICERLQTQIDPKITELILDLGKSIRKLNYNQLIKLTDYSEEGECKNRQQFKDILNSVIFQQGNSAAIQYLLKHIDQPMEMFYSLLALSHQPTEDAVKLIIPKFNEKLNKIDSSYQPVLGISSFIGKYCEESDCEQNDLIISTQKKLINKLGKRCSNKENRILLLKCIQNMNILDQLVPQILPCLDQESIATKLATVQLLDRSGIKSPVALDKLKSLFSDKDEKSELRINALIVLLKLLKFNRSIEDYLLSELENENNHQVLSFINSYVKNIKATDEAFGSTRKLAKVMSGSSKNENIFLFSKNIHLSTSFLKTKQLDGELNINLIRNNQNQLVNANVKGNIAIAEQDEKQSIEVGFFQNGLNNLVNKFMNELMKKSVNLQESTFQEMLNFIMTLKKDKKSIENLLDNINDDKESKESIKLTTYLNLNGKTIFLVDYSDEDRKQVHNSSKTRRSINFDSKSILNQDIERALVFIYLNKGFELSNPLSPIKFELTGVSVIGLKFNNQTLAPTFINDLSASIEIGDKQEHKIKFYSGQIFNPVFNYKIQPVDGDYILNIVMANSSIPVIRSTTFVGEQNMQERLIKETNGHSTCTSSLTSLIGIEFCFKEARNLDQPIQKLILYDIYIKKTDELLKSWQTILKFGQSADNLYDIVILFDTPGSKINRHFDSRIKFKKLNSNIQVNGTFSNQIQKVAANLNVNLNNLNDLDSKLHLYLNDELISIIDYIQSVKHFKTKSEYNPSLRLFISPNFNKPHFHLTGSLVIDLIKKNNLQFGLYSKTTNVQYLKGLITRTVNEKYLVDVLFNLPNYANLHLSSDVQFSKNKFLSTETKIDYNLLRMKLQDTIKISTKFSNTSNLLAAFGIFVNMRCSKHSKYNFDLNYNLKYGSNFYLENDFKFKYLNIKEFNVYQQYKLSRSDLSSNKSFRFENTFKVNLQPQQLTYQSDLNINFKPTSEQFAYKIAFTLDKVLNQLAIDLVKFDFGYEQSSKKPLKTYLETSLQLKGKFDISYRDELEEIGKNEFKGLNLLKWSKNKYVSLNYNYLIRNDIIGRMYKINADFQTHTMPDPYNHQILFEYQKTNLTLKSLFKIKDNHIWNFNLFSEHYKQFNLTLESDYLNIKNNLNFEPEGALAGVLLVDANKYVYFSHNTNLNYTNMDLFEINSLTLNQMRKNQDQVLANLTLSQQPTQLKFNLKSYLVQNVKLNYNKHDQIKSGQFEIQDHRFQHKSTWTINDENLHLKMKFVKANKTIGNLVLLTENYFNDCDLKGTFLNWNLNANSKFKNEGRKLIFVKLINSEQGKLLFEHTTNVSAAVTNGFIKSSTIKDGIKLVDFDASIQGRDSSKITLFVKELFQFDLVFNPFIKNKFADLEIKDLTNLLDQEKRRYLNAKFEYDPRSFQLNTNYLNRNLTYFKTTEQSTLNLDFDDLKFLGKCNHQIIFSKEFIQYGLKQFGNLTRNQVAKLTKQFDLKFFNRKKFFLNLDYENFLKIESDVNFDDSRSISMNVKRQPNQIEFKINFYKLLMIGYANEEYQKQIRLMIDLENDEFKFLNYKHKNQLINYSHETEIYLFKNYDLDARIEIINQMHFKLNYKLWKSIDLEYKKNETEIKVNLVKDELYYAEIKDKNDLYRIDLQSDFRTMNLLITNLEFQHESQLFINPKNKSYLFKLLTRHNIFRSKSDSIKIFNCELLISKDKESQLNLDYYNHVFNLKIDPFVQRKIQSIYLDRDRNLKSSTELMYLGPQTYHLYSNASLDDQPPFFKLTMISNRKKPTKFDLISYDWRLNGEFNFFKLNKQTGIIKIKNDVDKLFGNITLEADRKSFLIANYILLDESLSVKGRANLSLAMTSSEIVKFNYNDDFRTIFTKLLWLGDRMVLDSELNHIDYNHKLIGLLSYDSSKTVKLNMNKTYNQDKTFDCNLIASLTKPSYLLVDQLDFGNLNVSADLVNKMDQSIHLIFNKDNHNAKFDYLKQNSTIDSKLNLNLQNLHSILLIDSSFDLVDGKSAFIFNILEPDYKTKIESNVNLENDNLVSNLNAVSEITFIPRINSNLTLSGLIEGTYEMKTYWTVNQKKLNSHYKHKEYLNLEYSKLDRQYQAEIRKSTKLFESFIKRSSDKKSSILSFDLENDGRKLNSSIGLEHLNRKTTFRFIRLDEFADKGTFIFEMIFDKIHKHAIKDRKIYDLMYESVKNDQTRKIIVKMNNPHLKHPLLIDYERGRNDLILKWNLLEEFQINELKVNFKNFVFTELDKIVKAILLYNDQEIVCIDLEKVANGNEETRFYLNFFNSTFKLDDKIDKVIFNVNEKDLNLQVNKEDYIHFESNFKADKLYRKVVVHYDVKEKEISYLDLELESFRTLASHLILKPVPLSSIYISAFNSKDEFMNEIFLFSINTTDLNKRKLIMKHNEVYLFSRQFLKKQKKLVNEFWNNILFKTTDKKLTMKNYLIHKQFNGLLSYGHRLKEELGLTFEPIIKDWPIINDLIENLIQNYVQAFLTRFNELFQSVSNHLKHKYNLFLEDLELFKEYSIELFNVVYETFEYRFIILRKYLLKKYNIIQSFLNRQINNIKVYVPENYWDLILNLWSILQSSEFWKSKFPVFTKSTISFYF